jgi:NAD dependent epimerase/dehydratase family enzyme
MIQYVLENDSITGSVNATSPNPIRNRDFTAALARSLHRPAFLTIPAFALRVLPGKMAQELILASTRAVPDRLLKSGFRFKRDNIEEALQ